MELAPAPIPDGGDSKSEKSKSRSGPQDALWKALETAAFMLTSLSMLGLAGLIYHRGYKENSRRKMSDAVDRWDPVLELASVRKIVERSDDWVTRDQQKLLDDIVSGEIRGRYYILFGEKGTGKTDMLLEAIGNVNASNVVLIEAHADPEIFRLRMGKALNYEFHEDYLGSLFSIRGPRENTAILDIERAFNVLEEVALKRYRSGQRPIALIINNAHLIRDDETGQNLVELLQQKAEALSGSGLATIIFNSDDYWLYERFKKLGTRMDLISVSDFTRDEAIRALKGMRRRINGEAISSELSDAVYHLVGGRPQHLAAVASQPDILYACQRLIDREKQWFLNKCGLLGEDMDDDVMDNGKFATSAMALAREFVRMDLEMPHSETLELPKMPLWRARQIMTRPDFIQTYDNLNIFTLDSLSRVKPDSVVMMHAFREICSMPGFDELLSSSQQRVDDIESLNRTREIVLKDLVTGDGRYIIDTGTLRYEPPLENEETTSNIYMLDRSDKQHWKARMKYGNRRRSSTTTPDTAKLSPAEEEVSNPEN